MKKRVIAFVLALSCCIGLGAVASTDTVITLSYLNNNLKAQLADSMKKQVTSLFNSPQARSDGMFSRDGVMADVANRALEQIQMKGRNMYSTSGREKVVLKKDDVLSGLTGTTFIMREGSATVINDTIVNITKGREAAAKSEVSLNTNYMIPSSGGAGIRITSDVATIWVDGVYRVVSLRYHAKYFDRADALRAMNLFRGSNIGYELDRGASRTEALVMLLRLLGEENAALKYSGKHPFTDVPSWAEKYVAYAYYKGYTKGVSGTKFGSNDLTTVNQYMTFILRALGYNDAKGDFNWNKAIDFAKSVGFITEGERKSFSGANFKRDHMAYLSYYALFAKVKGSNTTLLNKLINSGAVSKTVSDAAIAKVTAPRL